MLKKVLGFAAPSSLPAGDCNVRMEGPSLRFESDLLACALDFRRQSRDPKLWLDTGPKRTAGALFEASNPADPELESVISDSRQRIGEIVRNCCLDFAYETQGQVELIVVLPAKIRAFGHRVDEEIADGFRRAKGDEKTMHGSNARPGYKKVVRIP